MRHIIFGDVHGCLAELQRLISELDLKSGDQLYFIGDLIDRGPDSAGVVKYVKRLSELFPLILIIGNHEEKFLRYLNHKKNADSAVNQMKGTAVFDQLANQLDASDIDFLLSSFLNYTITEAGTCLLHGGIPGNCHIDLKINHPYDRNLFKTLKGGELILKTRFLDQSGKFLSLDQENEHAVFWADRYDGRFGKVIFGHHAVVSEYPQEHKHAVNIDTGCVFGGWLTACVIEDGKTCYKTVKATDIYAARK